MRSEELNVELEALRFTYAEALTLLQEEPLAVRVATSPYTGDDSTKQFIAADLIITAGEGYPERPPDICLREVKGLGDSRTAELLHRLQQDAVESSGSMMLGMLCEAARDQLTAMNRPEGACIFCLDPLCHDCGSIADAELLKLPCYHCFHMDCFVRWWRWEQRSLHGKRKQLLEDLGARAAPVLNEQDLVADAKGLFAIQCPSCRLRVTPDDLAHVLPAMLPKKGNPAAGAVEQTEVFRRLELPPEDLQRLRLRQQQNARIFERQKSRNGLVDDSWGVSLGPSPGLTTHPEEVDGDLESCHPGSGQPKLPGLVETGQSSLSGMEQHSSKPQLQKGSSSSSGQQTNGPKSTGLRQAAYHEQSTGFRPGGSRRVQGQRGNRGLRGRGRNPSSAASLGGRQRGRQPRGGVSPQERQQDVIPQ